MMFAIMLISFFLARPPLKELKGCLGPVTLHSGRALSFSGGGVATESDTLSSYPGPLSSKEHGQLFTGLLHSPWDDLTFVLCPFTPCLKDSLAAAWLRRGKNVTDRNYCNQALPLVTEIFSMFLIFFILLLS